MSVELCACGHENTHAGRRCGKPVEMPDGTTAICPCAAGVRVDLATLQVLADQGVTLNRIATTLMRLLAVAETATGLQSSIVDDGNGRKRVDVQPRQAVPQILIPR